MTLRKYRDTKPAGRSLVLHRTMTFTAIIPPPTSIQIALLADCRRKTTKTRMCLRKDERKLQRNTLKVGEAKYRFLEPSLGTAGVALCRAGREATGHNFAVRPNRVG